jgi:prepilin-type N-terminal cleavage/methylation domain-containing protein
MKTFIQMCNKTNKMQAGFSVVEMIVAVAVLAIVSGAVFALMRDSMKVASTTYEMTDAQESLRTAQEYLNRDLLNAGDALTSVSNILVPRTFVTNYLTVSPVDDPSRPGVTNLSILTSDNNTPAGTVIRNTNPVATVHSNPLTDRITMLQIDPTFTPIALSAPAINATGDRITIAAADVGRFTVGEIYFLSSAAGATFGTITSITATPQLVFANGDACGLNVSGNGGRIYTVSAGGTLPTSLMRVKIVHYYVTSGGLLMRRVLGVRGGGFSDSLIAEHVISLQFRYFLSLRDGSGNVVQPVEQLTDSTAQLALNQVEVTVSVETPHAIQNGSQQQLTMTTATSVRNMQFKGALQPTAGG